MLTMAIVEKLSNIVRSVSLNNEQHNSVRSSQTTPTPWDGQTVRDRERERERERERPRSRDSHRQRDSKDSREYAQSSHTRDYYSQRDSKDSSQRDRIERYGSRAHGRNVSSGTGGAASTEYAEGRRHDYDLQAMEADLSSPRTTQPKRPIPSPIVTVRSEYPSLTRSKLSQTLTCLITVEVPGGKWSPDAQDLRLPHMPNLTPEREVASPKMPSSVDESSHETESTEELDEVTEDLRARVENWHGLDFSRFAKFFSLCLLETLMDNSFGKLRLFGTLRVSRDQNSWQELECFLFAEMLICIKEKRGAAPIDTEGNSKRKLTKCTLRGSILIKKHFKAVESSSGTLIPFQIDSFC